MKKREPLAHALLLQKAAARQGFDWDRAAPLWAKLREEVGELREVAHQRRRGEEELGDLLFMVVNLARHYRLDPVRALKQGNRKFVRRYGYILKHADTLPPLGHPRRLAQMEKLWQHAKRRGL
ncbi:MAG: MazG nucleotide pyrophosphohydrolase domain-containing protein [Pseudomonadota bacterium]